MIQFPEIYKNFLNLASSYNYFVAGGLLNSMYYNRSDDQDMDIFFRNEEDFEALKKFCLGKFTMSADTGNAVTFNLKYKAPRPGLTTDEDDNIYSEIYCDDIHATLQLIKRDFGTPEYIMSLFDINKTMIAFENKKLIISDMYKEPLHLINHNRQSLQRLAKYSTRTGESADWTKYFKHYFTDFAITDFYEGKKIECNSSEAITCLVKNYLTTYDTDERTKKDITEAIALFSKSDKFIYLIQSMFVPANTVLSHYFLKVLYYKAFCINDAPRSLANIIQINLKDCVDEIKIKNPEYLFCGV